MMVWLFYFGTMKSMKVSYSKIFFHFHLSLCHDLLVVMDVFRNLVGLPSVVK